MSRAGKPRGDHMAEAFDSMAAAARAGPKSGREMADVYDLAARCIRNETAMFDALSTEAAALLTSLENGK